LENENDQGLMGPNTMNIRAVTAQRQWVPNGQQLMTAIPSAVVDKSYPNKSVGHAGNTALVIQIVPAQNGHLLIVGGRNYVAGDGVSLLDVIRTALVEHQLEV